MWVAVKREGGSFRAACKVVPRLLLFMGWISFYNYFSGDPFAAFMESMVRCPIPEPIGPMGHQTCPKGASFFNGTCVPVGNRHKHWSLSAKCADKAFVMKKTASLNGMNQFVAAGLSLASVAVAGSIMDAFGRKPILVSALVVNVAVKLMLFGSCFLPWAGFAIVLMVQNVLMVMSMSPMYPAMNAMVADLTPDDESRRGTCYAAMEVVNHMMDVVAFLCGYPVLALHLADYRLFWGLLAVVGTLALVFFSVVLRETRTLGVASRCELPRTNTEESEKVVRMQTRVVTSRGCRIVFSGLGGGLCAVWNDGFLRQYFVIWAFVSVGINSTWGLAQMYAQSFLDLSPETASMSRALWHVSLTIGSMLSSPLIDRFGASDTLTLALFIMACGWGISGFESVVPVSADFLFWACSVGLGGIAYGMMTPSSNTIVSGRIDESLQGKVFAGQMIINILIGMPVGLLWPFYVFEPKSTGLRAGLMWNVSASIFLICGIWNFCLSRFSFAAKPERVVEAEFSDDDSATSSVEDDELSVAVSNDDLTSGRMSE